MSAVTLEQVLLAGFQTSGDADKQTEQLRSSLGLQARNRVARLAIGRSLAEATYPTGSLDGAGKSIKGDVLFGLEELPLWVGLLFTHLRRADPRAELTLPTLQDLVKRHWNRGIALLYEDWEEAGEDYNKFVDVLVRRRANLPENGGVSPTSSTTTTDRSWALPGGAPVPVTVELGKLLDTNEPFS
jgi:DNA sulfur modification protein DndE